MARPNVHKLVTKTPGVRKVTRTYGDGRVTIKYEVRHTNPEGEVVNGGTYDDYRTACQVLIDLRGRVQQGTYIAPESGRVLFRSVAEDWYAGTAKRKQRTRAGYRGILDHRLAPLHNVQVGRLRYREVNRFVSGLSEEGLAPSTVRNVLLVLRGVLEEAVKQELIAKNPCLLVDKPKLVKSDIAPLEIADVEALIAELPAPWDLLVELAAYSGLRAGELAGLRVGRVDLLRREVTVAQTVVDVRGRLVFDKPKSKAGQRTVRELPPSLCQRVARHVAASGLAKGDLLFGQDGIKPLRHGQFYRRHFLPAARAAGLTRVRFHDLRHFYASLLISDPETSPLEVSQQLGHTTVALTMDRYAHLFHNAGQGRGDRLEHRRQAAQHDGVVVPLRSVESG